MESKQIAVEVMQDFVELLRGPANVARGMSRGEMGVLTYAAFSGEDVSPTAISREFNISTARVANVLNGLERKQYVIRSVDPTDRRKVRIRVTEQGRELAEYCADDLLDKVQTVMEQLGEQDAREVHRLLSRVRQVCEETFGA